MVGVQEVAWPPLPAHWWTLYPCRQWGGDGRRWKEEEERRRKEEEEEEEEKREEEEFQKKVHPVYCETTLITNFIPRFLYGAWELVHFV